MSATTGSQGGAPSAPNGRLMAAVLAAGVGSFAVGLFVLLNQAGLYAAPSLYAPAGGLSGRTTFAVVVWLLTWAVLARLWRDREVDAGRVGLWTLALVALGLLATFPPVWGVFG